MQSGNSMKKYASLFLCACVCAIGIKVFADGFGGDTPSPMSLIINGNSTGTPIQTGDTVSLAFPTASTRTEISKSDYDTYAKEHIGRSSFFYSESVNGQIHYYRYDVNFAYMAVDGTTIVDKSHADASALWRVMTQAGDATHARRYQHLQTGKWLKCEITNGQVVWELVDDVAHSSLITHQWTTVLDYQKDARTFAYPIILNGTEAFYIYFDQQAAKWTYNKDVTGIVIDPMYCEKWSEHKSLSLELDALLPAGTNYFAFTQGDAGAQECQITIWPKLADSTYIHSVPGKRLNYDNLHINEVVTIEDNINTLESKGYSFGVNWCLFGGDILNQPPHNDPSTTYIPFSHTDVTQIENSTYQAGAYNAVTTQTASYQDSPREMMKAELIENSNTEWIIKVTPKGKSPLNWWVKGIGWADFTDLVKMTVTKDGKTVATREFPMIRESRHYLEEETLEPFITPTQHTFSATGGTLTVKLDSVIESHHIDLYDTKGYLVPSYTTIIQSTKLIPGTAAYNQKVERQVSLQKEGSTDKPEWLDITSQTDAEITIQCGQNEGANSRLGILHSAYTNKTTGQIYAVETRLFQNGGHTAGDIKFNPNGGWGYTTLGSDGRQKVHTTETTIYYHEGEEVELRLRERNFFGYMRWYDYHTGADPKFYTASDGTMKEQQNFWSREPLKYIAWKNNPVQFDPINTNASDSHGLYFTMEGQTDEVSLIHDRNLKDNDSEVPERKWNWGGIGYKYTHPRLLVPIVNGWNPDKPDYPAHRDIACDVSNYTDYKEAATNGNKFEEPTLSYRHIFHLRPAKEMADTLAKCVDDNDDEYFEDYTYIAPVGTEVLLKTQYAHANPYYANRPSDLCYYFYIQKNGQKQMTRLSMKDGVKVVLYENKVQIGTPTYKSNSDYIPVKSNSPGTVTYKLKIENGNVGSGATIYGNKPILLARWKVTYVDKSKYGPSATELISRSTIETEYIPLAEKDFNYNQPGTKDMVLYDKPLDAEESSFGFCYPSSVVNGNSQRLTDNNPPFPYFGEYAIVNRVGVLHGSDEWLKDTEQRGGAENGYCLYVDGSQRPGKVVTLSTNAKICSGQQLYCSAWICNPAKKYESDGRPPIFRFDVEGRNPGGKWEAAGSFYTGEIGLDYGGQWLQIRFPVVSAHDYEESRITIYNYAATNTGNDFLVDDVMLYATRLPLGAYQATTSCKRGALNDSLVTMIKVDYTLLTEGYAGKTLYYRIYNQTDKTPVVTNYYNNKNATFGWIQMQPANYKPTDEEKCESVSEFAGEMSGYTNDTVCVKYIWTEDMNHPRWVMYIAQLVNGSLLDSKKDYEVQTAYAKNDLDHASCAMRTKLPVYEKTAYTFNGETYPTTGYCANDLYPIEILVTDQVDVAGKLTEMKAYAKGDWLKGYNFDDIWYDAYLDIDTIGKRGAADAAFEARYGYTRWQIEDAIRDMRRESTTEKPNPNFAATDVSQLKSEPKYWDNTEHYTIICQLCKAGLLELAKERQVLYMHSNDTVRYWVYPIANTAKATYNNTEYILNTCTEPTYIKVFTQKSDYELNLSNKTHDELTGINIPRARISLSAANSRFGIPIKEIGNDVALCYDSTQVVYTTDPIVSALIGKPNFSMHYTEDKMYQDYPGNRYYKAGDTIWFTPIDAAHVQAMQALNKKEDWPDGHPGLWIKNTHSMRAGYEYTLRVQMMTRSNQALDAADGCLIGYSPITVVVVPDTMIWTPTIADAQGRYSWADDRNWRGRVDGKTLTWGYTPISETMVILPTGLDKEKYPYIPEDKGDNILYPLDVNYHTNVCKKVQFRKNALMLGQENLKYEQAYVDMVLPANAFYSISAPLQGMYSGDLYVPHNGRIGESTTMRESDKAFEVSGFQGTRDSLAGYAFWAMYYNQDVYRMYNSGEGNIVSTTASFLQSNKLDMLIAPGQGIAAAGFGPTGNEKDITVRLPKPDTKYNYYTNTGAMSDQSVSVDRTHSYKLAYTPNASGDMEVTLRVKNEVNAGIVGFDNNTTGFLFGNPTMAYIDMFKLMDANPNVLSHVGYQVMTGDKYTTVLRAAGTTDHYLAPMQSAIVLPRQNTKSITLKIPSNCLVLNPYAPTGSVQPAPRRAMGHTFRSDRMDIMVYSDGGKGSAILLARDFADNA